MYSLTQGGNVIALSGLISEILKLTLGINLVPDEIKAILIAAGIIISWFGRYRQGDITFAGFRK